MLMRPLRTGCVTAEEFANVIEVADGEHRHVRNRSRFSSGTDRYDHRFDSRGSSGDCGSDRAWKVPDAAVQAEFTDEKFPVTRWDVVGRAQETDRDREIQPGSTLRQISRSQTDGDATHWPWDANGAECGPDSPSRFTNRGMCQADDSDTRQPLGDIYLNTDHRAAHSTEDRTPHPGLRHA
jgi:hypothetical protein